ncbi:MAG: hypothetical protein Q8L15_04155 [Methylobacter sp.]|nr:hypothetical protein [Methylobacter sp.]
MVFSKTHQLYLPSNFPFTEMDAFKAAADRLLMPETSIIEEWQEYAGAINLIGWRFRNCHEDMERWIGSLNMHGENGDFEEEYLRDRALFGFFTAGLSCIESTCYALSALAYHLALLDLPSKMDKKWYLYPKDLEKRLLERPKTVALKTKLHELTGSNEFERLKQLRDRVTHRSNLPRNQTLSISNNAHQVFAKTNSTKLYGEETELTINELFLKDMLAWLAESVRALLVEGTRLCEQP